MIEELTDAVQALAKDVDALDKLPTWFDVLAVIVPIAVSFLALWFSIRGTEQQNKIMLFEKRFTFYSTLTKCERFFRLAQKPANQKYLQIYLIGCFSNNPIERIPTDNEATQSALALYNSISEILWQGEFLFDFKVEPTVLPCINLMHCAIAPTKDGSCSPEDINSVIIKIEDTLSKAEKVLKLSKGGNRRVLHRIKL